MCRSGTFQKVTFLWHRSSGNLLMPSSSLRRPEAEVQLQLFSDGLVPFKSC